MNSTEWYLLKRPGPLQDLHQGSLTLNYQSVTPPKAVHEKGQKHDVNKEYWETQ
jgi:hypothetical protein